MMGLHRLYQWSYLSLGASLILLWAACAFKVGRGTATFRMPDSDPLVPWILGLPVLAVVASVAAVMTRSAQREPTELRVPRGFQDADEWLQGARERAERLGFLTAGERGSRLQMLAREPWPQSLDIEARPDRTEGFGRILHCYLRPFPGDPGQDAYAADLVAYVAGETLNPPAPARQSYGAVSAFVGANIGVLLALAAACLGDPWRSACILWAVAIAGTGWLALVIDGLRGRIGKRLALGAVVVAILSALSAGLVCVEKADGRRQAELDWEAGTVAWRDPGPADLSEVDATFGIPFRYVHDETRAFEEAYNTRVRELIAQRGSPPNAQKEHLMPADELVMRVRSGGAVKCSFHLDGRQVIVDGRRIRIRSAKGLAREVPIRPGETATVAWCEDEEQILLGTWEGSRLTHAWNVRAGLILQHVSPEP